MDRRRELLIQLLSRSEMQECFPSSLDGSKKIEDTVLFRLLEQMWPLLRENNDSDEECAENLAMLLRIIAELANSGRLGP